jgi:hypothetical protein
MEGLIGLLAREEFWFENFASVAHIPSLILIWQSSLGMLLGELLLTSVLQTDTHYTIIDANTPNSQGEHSNIRSQIGDWLCVSTTNSKAGCIISGF